MSRRRASWSPQQRWRWLRPVIRLKTPKVERKPARIPKWRRYRNLPNWRVAS